MSYDINNSECNKSIEVIVRKMNNEFRCNKRNVILKASSIMSETIKTLCFTFDLTLPKHYETLSIL